MWDKLGEKRNLVKTEFVEFGENGTCRVFLPNSIFATIDINVSRLVKKWFNSLLIGQAYLVSDWSLNRLFSKSSAQK